MSTNSDLVDRLRDLAMSESLSDARKADLLLAAWRLLTPAPVPMSERLMVIGYEDMKKNPLTAQFSEFDWLSAGIHLAEMFHGIIRR